ncbi:TniQ family protein [uncultured Deefgea sp.]|uniref:TniQ family protein n=1 Tax=uncultured Deefgea sp. TaxID=1304914 RepID=UPI002592BF2D|nr:TniQ family protein [uncultured Deefgea sp.]
MLSGKLWPAHPHPYPDELLSSWLVRIAHANGLKVQTFCAQQFGNEHQIWNRDIDRLAPTWLLEIMSKKTGTPLKIAQETTLLSYEGKLYERHHSSGLLRWILPLQIYHRTRNGFGLQCCPKCLTEDSEPYYRKSWRVALWTFCPKHQNILLDRCPNCSSSIIFHRIELGRPKLITPHSLSICWNCGHDFGKKHEKFQTQPITDIFADWSEILQKISQNTITNADYSRLAVLHQFCTLIVSSRLAPKLQQYLLLNAKKITFPTTQGRLAFEQRPLQERHSVIELAWWLLDCWPNRLRDAWCAKVVRYNVLSKDFANPPAWYLSELASFFQNHK